MFVRFTEEWQNGVIVNRRDIAASMTPAEVFTQRQKESRELAGDKIELLVGDAVKQRNAMAYAQMLQRKEAVGLIALTPQEQATLDGMEAQFIMVIAIRQASNLIEAEMLDLEDDPVLMMDYDIEKSPLWPEDFGA